MRCGQNEVLHRSGFLLDPRPDDVLVTCAAQQLDVLFAHQARVCNDHEVTPEIVALNEVVHDGDHRVSLELRPVE